MNDMHDFSSDKQRAIAEMFDMNKKASKIATLPPQHTVNNAHKSPKSPLGNLRVSVSSDDIIIIGLMLILAEDCQDTWLFLALAYILMG